MNYRMVGVQALVTVGIVVLAALWCQTSIRATVARALHQHQEETVAEVRDVVWPILDSMDVPHEKNPDSIATVLKPFLEMFRGSGERKDPIGGELKPGE